MMSQEPAPAMDVAGRKYGCTNRAFSHQERTECHGLLLERHQDNERPVRTHAARHLLRRKTDRAVTARDDRKSERSTAQARFSESSGRNQEPCGAAGTGLQAVPPRAQRG